jgi:hypothetical protein
MAGLPDGYDERLSGTHYNNRKFRQSGNKAIKHERFGGHVLVANANV